jgi:acyl-CoA thioester hydrolase
MSSFYVVTNIQTRFCDFDVMGHLNNAVYSTYIELARVHFFQDVLGMDLTQTAGVVANFNINFKRPVKFATPLVVLSQAHTPDGRHVHMNFLIADARDHSKVYSNATQHMVAVDPQTSQLAHLPKRIQRDMELLMSGELKHPAVAELPGHEVAAARA